MYFVKVFFALALLNTAVFGAPAPIIDALEVESVNVVVKGE